MTARAPRIPRDTRTDPELLGALIDWQASVVRLDDVDPLTTEIVRLRCARHHDCHT